ncbi:5140_t:CDS:1, partial [Gigaspora margarita]
SYRELAENVADIKKKLEILKAKKEFNNMLNKALSIHLDYIDQILSLKT